MEKAQKSCYTSPMKIKRILNPVVQENTYILENDTACLVIDPGSDTSKILTLDIMGNKNTIFD